MTKRKAAGWLGFSAVLVLLAVLAPQVAGFTCYVAGTTFNRLGLYQAAAGTLNRALAINPRFARGYVELGSAYIGLEKYQEAEQAFLKAKNLRDESCASCGLGTAYHKLHRYEDAEKSFQHSIDLDANDVCPYERAGRMYYDINRFQQAIASFKHAISLNPSFASYMYLGNSYVYAREFQPGVDAYKEALRLKANDVRGHIQLGVAYDYMNRNQEAVEEFKSALKLDAANSKAHYRLIISYLKLGNKPAAITEYQILQARDPKYTSESLEDLVLLTQRERGKEKLYFLPLNSFSSDDVKLLVTYYKETTGIDAIALAPLPLRLAAIDNRRQQLVAEDIIGLMKSSNPNLAGDPNAIVIGLTNEDMYSRSYDWKFAFSRWQGRFAVVSSARMNPYNLGAAPDNDLLNIRLRKMVTKNIGVLYYELPTTDDPRSVMYDGINSVEDLDNMCEDF